MNILRNRTYDCKFSLPRWIYNLSHIETGSPINIKVKFQYRHRYL